MPGCGSAPPTGAGASETESRPVESYTPKSKTVVRLSVTSAESLIVSVMGSVITGGSFTGRPSRRTTSQERKAQGAQAQMAECFSTVHRFGF